jgi:hypothetical protein
MVGGREQQTLAVWAICIIVIIDGMNIILLELH